jgi:serine/threonine protein kinase
LYDQYDVSGDEVLVMERITGCDMFDYLQEHGPMIEKEALYVFVRVFRCVVECYRRGVVHRDIKDESIMIDRIHTAPKLIDFGCASLLTKADERFHEFLGTLAFAPPEWFKHRVFMAQPSTVWQLGCLLYIIMNGSEPFPNSGDILSACPKWLRPASSPCQDFLSRCLNVDTRKRASFAELAAHTWLAASMEALELTQDAEAKIVIE